MDIICARHNLRIGHHVEFLADGFRNSRSQREFAGILVSLLALRRGRKTRYLSLAAAIDQSSLTPREQLGLRLFFDSNLSEPAGTACASCHDPRRAFTGNNNTLIGVAQGSRTDQFGTRDAPTVMYLGTAPRFGSIERDGKRVPAGGHFWDGVPTRSKNRRSSRFSTRWK